MTKAYEVMTKTLATVHPDDSVAHAAKIMKERDIGDVLIVDEGKLQGIVTDRDLALYAMAEGDNPQSSPVSRYMTPNIITGSSGWSLNKVANTMAKHQIRRLPIVDDDEVVGIISLGDVARQYGRKDVIYDSLKNISRPNYYSSNTPKSGVGKWIGLSLAALAVGAMSWMTWSHTGKQFKKQMVHSKPYYTAAQAMNYARTKVNEAATSKKANELRRQVRSNIKGISAQLPTIQYRPPKKRGAWFR